MGPHCSGYGEKCEALFCLCLKGCATLLLLCTIRGRGIQWLPLKLGVSIYCGSIGHNRVLRGCGHVNSPCEPSRRTGTVLLDGSHGLLTCPQPRKTRLWPMLPQ